MVCLRGESKPSGSQGHAVPTVPSTQYSARGGLCPGKETGSATSCPPKVAVSHRPTGNPVTLSKAQTADGRRWVIFSSVAMSQTVQLQGTWLAAQTGGRHRKS